MTLSSLFTFYLVLAFLILLAFAFWKKKGRKTTATTLCPTCGERFLVREGEALPRCPRCGFLK